MSWNVVLNKCIKIKNEYISKFGEPDFSEFTENGNTISCLERWVQLLENEEYIRLFKPLQIGQDGDFILLRYGRYCDIYGFEEDVTLDSFWEMYGGFYLECRSIVIDIVAEQIVLSPFKKFKNLGEGKENQIDIITQKIKKANSVEISDKLDGSMQSARYYNSKIIMSGSKAIKHENSWRLQDGYKMLTDDALYRAMVKNNPDFTFIFEYISLKDMHVVRYSEEQEGLYLIGIRNSLTGKQLSYTEVLWYANKYHVRTTTVFKKTLKDVMGDIAKYKSHEREGYVINIDGHLLKVKCDDYVEMHRVLSATSSPNLVIKHIGDDTFDDFISKVPTLYRDRVYEIADVVFAYIHKMKIKIARLYNEAPKDSRKNFAIWCSQFDKVTSSYLMAKYLKQPLNFVRSNNGRYKKMHEMEGK